jgi:nitrogen regulatory protein PII
MSQREITILTDLALITCIVQRGLGDAIVHAARDAGAQGATIYYARGSGVRERLGVLGVAVAVEKEIINIVAATEQLDAIFDSIYLAGKLDTPGMGFMYVTALEKAATYIPPEVVKKLGKKS